MTRLEQLERMVEVLRGALHDVEAVDYPYYPETRRICGESLSLSDRIAAEPVELTDAEVVIGWAMADGRHSMQLDVTKVLFWIGDGPPVFEGGIPTAAAWIRAQGAE